MTGVRSLGRYNVFENEGFNWDLVQQAGQIIGPDKYTLNTEACVCGPAQPLGSDWSHGEWYGADIVNDLAIGGARGWVDWNLLLDARGGPNHVQNFCEAPVMRNQVLPGPSGVDREQHAQHQGLGTYAVPVGNTSQLVLLPQFWYMGHVSRFVPPGAIILNSSLELSSSLLEAAAAARAHPLTRSGAVWTRHGEVGSDPVTPPIAALTVDRQDGVTVVVLLNTLDDDVTVNVEDAPNRVAAVPVPAHGAVTLTYSTSA